MTFKYALACLIVFAILIFLKFVEGSPVRSWKGAIFTALCLSVMVCFYLRWAFPKPLPPTPRAEKVLAYRAELERDFRRIQGVESASITGSTVRINMAEEKSSSELRQLALTTGGTAAAFMKNGNKFQITIIMSVRGEERYQAVIDPDHGVVREQIF